MGNAQQYPFYSLGSKLRSLRQRHQKTIAEVSGAVEIDVQDLQNFELGKVRPSEDILDLLLLHFETSSQDAAEVWRLAGYDRQNNQDFQQLPGGMNIMIIPVDNRAVYSDMVQVSSNNFGLTLHFMQGAGGVKGQPVSVSKVGMSREHAQSMIELLQKALIPPKPKQLAPPVKQSKLKNKQDRSSA
jgi:hypothetical protein